MIDHEIGLSTWVWDKKGKTVSTGFTYIGLNKTEEEAINKAKEEANRQWQEWPNKVFNKCFQITQGRRNLKKVLLENRNYKPDTSVHRKKWNNKRS